MVLPHAACCSCAWAQVPGLAGRRNGARDLRAAAGAHARQAGASPGVPRAPAWRAAGAPPQRCARLLPGHRLVRRPSNADPRPRAPHAAHARRAPRPHAPELPCPAAFSGTTAGHPAGAACASRARLHRGGPEVVLSYGSERTHGHTQVRVSSILGLGLGKIGDFMMRFENCFFPLLLNGY